MPAPAASFSRGPLLWVGLLLMCVGVALTALLYFLFLVSVPIFLLGLVLVLRSGQPLWCQALAVLFPFLAAVALAMSVWELGPREQPTTFLIPAGFEGPILLIRNEQCAPPPRRENGRVVYRVPANGLLITRDTVPNRDNPYYNWPNKGYYQLPDNRYYVVDRQGHRLRELTELHGARTLGDNPKTSTSLFGENRDELAAFYETPLESEPDSSGIGFVFQYITIATQNRHDSLYNAHSLLRLRALADSLLPRCRVRSGQPPQGLWKPKPNPFDVPFDSTAK
ncbi:DUF6843 domain-containing protein [Hymenobacter psoromatis]|uniref:DUF6843 domain-containing protein n=1 Tax=Hymenobacter psoromatis TaxID=1484116 RepID=UPI001CBA93EA|nr:hypothetical protein [Hymenobacter psoromatis]